MNRIIPAGVSCRPFFWLAATPLLSILLFRVTTVLPLMWRLPGTLSTHYGTKVCFPYQLPVSTGVSSSDS